MSHLDIDTIIDYVMINEINDETTALAVKVGTHIRDCSQCRELVDAYLRVYESLIEESVNRKMMSEQLRNILRENMAKEEKKREYYASSEFGK